MGMDQIRALLACMEKKHGVVSVRGGRYEHGPDQGFTGVYGEEAKSCVRARRGGMGGMDQIRALLACTEKQDGVVSV